MALPWSRSGLLRAKHLGRGVEGSGSRIALAFLSFLPFGVWPRQFHRVGSYPRGHNASLEDQMLKSEFRQTLGAQPWKRLKARLNASSDSYPTRRATAATVVSVVASISWAMCIRQSVR